MSLPYKDPDLPVEARVADLLARMTLTDKAGLMFHNVTRAGPGGTLIDDPAQLGWGVPVREMIEGRAMNHFNLVGRADPAEIAAWHNAVQEIALSTRLGIPATLSSDPRHHFTDNPFASALAQGFTDMSSTVPMFGASGAISGVLGAYIVLYPRANVLVAVPLLVVFYTLRVPAWLVLGMWFVGQLLSSLSTHMSITDQQGAGVAFGAHIGGFIAGLLLIGLFVRDRHAYRY